MQSNDVVRDQPMSALNQLKCTLTLAHTALSEQKDAEAKHFDERAVDLRRVGTLGLAHPASSSHSARADGSELRVLSLDRTEDLLERGCLGELLAESGVAKEAGNARKCLEVLTARVLRHHEQEE
jgi:hypothetical protein